MIFKLNALGTRLPRAGSLCRGCLVWGLLLSLSMLVVPLSFEVSLGVWFLTVSAPPTIFSVVSCLRLTVGSLFCRSSDHLLG